MVTDGQIHTTMVGIHTGILTTATDHIIGHIQAITGVITIHIGHGAAITHIMHITIITHITHITRITRITQTTRIILTM